MTEAAQSSAAHVFGAFHLHRTEEIYDISSRSSEIDYEHVIRRRKGWKQFSPAMP